MFDENQKLTPEFMMQAAAMMFSLGADTLCSYYGENLFPDADYRRYTDCLRRLRTLTEGGFHRTDGLLLYPFEGFCSECEVFASELLPTRGEDGNGALQDLRRSYEQMTERLADAQYAFDFIDLHLLRQLRFADGQILLASGDRPHTLILPRLKRLDGGLDEVVRQAVAAGVEVCMDGEPVGFPGVEGIRFLGSSVPGDGWIRPKDSVPMLNLIRFTHADGDRVLAVNTDGPAIRTELILPAKGVYEAVDPFDGRIIGEGTFDGRLPLEPDGLQAVLFTLKY